MNAEDIIRRNKLKRQGYVGSGSQKKEKLDPCLRYIKGLISRVLLAIIFVLGSIIFTNISVDNKKIYKKYVLEDSVQFTKINKIYQELFGRVDPVKPVVKGEADKMVINSINYSNIENYKNGVKMMVGVQSPVNVITSGIVVFIGEKDDIGNTVIIQGNDAVDISYSNITDTDIKIYDYVEAGTVLGTANSEEIYLSFNQNGKYLSYDEYKKLASS